MAEELELAAQYRKHAKALFEAAQFDRHMKTSAALKQVARAYEHMADALEGIHRTNAAAQRERGAAGHENRSGGAS